MKKYRLASLLLVFALLPALLLPFAAAADSGSAILDGIQIQAKAAILVDVDYGEVLYEQNAHEKMYPASITKVMTAMLALEAVDRGTLSLDQVVTVSASLNRGIGEGGSTADIKEGEQMTVKDLLACALIPSANEACNALAEAVSGDVDDFVVLMNQRAGELGMEDTHFTNTHGYHDDDHYTTAYDVALMCEQAMKNPTFREIVSSRSYDVPATNLHEARTLHDTNALVSTFRIRGYFYEFANGIKTGSTPEAGYCLASSAEKNGRHLIAVVLGAENPKSPDGKTTYRLQFSESSRLLEIGFNDFSRRTILDDTALVAEMPVTLSKSEAVAVRPNGVIEASLPNDVDVADFTRDWTLNAESVEAPVAEGQVLGSITVSYGGKEYGTLDLVALNSVERSDLLYYLDRIEKFCDQLWVKILIAAVLVLIVALILRRVFFRGRRGGGGRRKGGYAYSGRSNYSGGRRRRR